MFKPLMSAIMTEAHAAAKADLAWVRANDPRNVKSYGYFLGLQMRNAFARARTAAGIMTPGFQIVEPKRWAGTPSRR